MSKVEVMPELKEIIGAMLFGAKAPLTTGDIRRVLKQVAETHGGPTKDFAKATESQVKEAVGQLKSELDQGTAGIHIAEVAKGFRLQNDSSCGPWLRHLLEKGRPNRLSHPALETMAIIAYRQPCTRGEIEAVRGVSVDNIIRNLLELQLIRVVGRSDLPGRPWLFGTTQQFLEHFGINNLDELPGVEELRRMEEMKKGSKQEEKEEVEESDEPTSSDEEDQADEADPDEDEFDDNKDEE